jgi:hypothetical protein
LAATVKCVLECLQREDSLVVLGAEYAVWIGNSDNIAAGEARLANDPGLVQFMGVIVQIARNALSVDVRVVRPTVSMERYKIYRQDCGIEIKDRGGRTE